MAVHTPLNDAQLTLLRLFGRGMSAEETQALRNVLMEFYEKELQNELDRVIEQKDLKRKDFEEQLHKQQRSSS